MGKRVLVVVLSVVGLMLVAYIGVTLRNRSVPPQIAVAAPSPMPSGWAMVEPSSTVVSSPVAAAPSPVAVPSPVPSVAPSPVPTQIAVAAPSPVPSVAPVAVASSTSVPSPVAAPSSTSVPSPVPNDPTVLAEIMTYHTAAALELVATPMPGCARKVVQTERDVSGHRYVTVQLPVRSYMLFEGFIDAVGLSVINPADSTSPIYMQPVMFLEALQKKTEDERNKLPPGFIFQPGTYTLQYDNPDSVSLMICPVVP